MKTEFMDAEPEEGEFSASQNHEAPSNFRTYEAEKALTYKVLRWNHNVQNSVNILSLQIIISEQLPELPSEYIHKVISSEKHTCLIAKLHNKVIGGAVFRIFKTQSLAELIFFAVSSDHQGKGFGKRLMQILKEFLNMQLIRTILVFADDRARMFFKKQGFSMNITLQKSVYQGLINEYSGSKLMECKLSSFINYMIADEIIKKQKEYIDQQIKQICIAEVFPKKSMISAIKQKKGFLDPFPNVSQAQIICKFYGFQKYGNKPKDSSLNSSNIRVSIQEECKELIYQILNHEETSSFHSEKIFYESTPDSQNTLNGVNFAIIFRKIQNEEYANLSEFIRDLNSFIMLIEDKYTFGEKKVSAKKLKDFLESKITNLKYLENVLLSKEKQKQPEQNQIQLENNSFSSQ